MRINHKIAVLAILFMAFAFCAGAAEATLCFDRGLPTENLNTGVGNNQSNTSWSYVSPDLVGDTFSFGQVGSSYGVYDIRVWVVGETPAATSLWGGTGGSISQLSTTYTTSVVSSYTYIGQTGESFNVYAVDFQLRWMIEGGTEYYFFIGGDGADGPYVHASNGGLSGSRQDGSDNLIWKYNTGTEEILPVDTSKDTYYGDYSDINVQVFATPEPSTILLFGFGLAGMAVFRKRFRRA